MRSFDSKLASRLGKLIPRLASDSDGEVFATVRAIRAALAAEGLDLHDLAATLTGAEIIKAAAVAQFSPAPALKAMSHQEQVAWMALVLASPETTEFQRQRLQDFSNRLRNGMHFTPHWRYVRIFDERVAQLHAKGVRP